LTTPNPEHLFEQADRLAAAPAAGTPRQVDLRRAISAAYYGVFHFILRTAADDFIGAAHQATSRYALVYRSVDHHFLRELCGEAQKPTVSRKFRKYLPGGFGPDMQAFARAVAELQERRYSADYDPVARFKVSDARLAIATGRSALARFESTGVEDRRMFLALLLFDPR
jgi:hypothetical protein